MSAAEKAEVLTKVASSPLPKRKVLGELGIPKSTYYRWLRRHDHQGLEDHAGGGKPTWNRLTSQEVHYVLSAAREMPELSCRQLAAWITEFVDFATLEIGGFWMTLFAALVISLSTAVLSAIIPGADKRR